ncbi:unnamed protein product, partial [Rotaria sordida]
MIDHNYLKELRNKL